jgi:hypothetical protein
MKCKDCGAEMRPMFLDHSMFCPNDCDRKPKVQSKKEEVPDYVPPGFTQGPWWNYTYVPIVPDPTMSTGSIAWGGYTFSNVTFTSGSMNIGLDEITSASMGALATAWSAAVDEAFDRWSPFEDDQEEE